jgi:hypothetical protein
MKCSSCNATGKTQCRNCQKWACRQHSNLIFDEKTRAFSNLCGACYSQERRLNWVRERF